MVETLKASHITIHDAAEDKGCDELENRFRQALKHRSFSHKEEPNRFVPFLPPQSLATTQKCIAAQKTVDTLTGRTVLAFEKTFWCSWMKKRNDV